MDEEQSSCNNGVVYSINEHFSQRLSLDKVLVTTRHGGWCIINDDDYDKLYTNRVLEDRDLFLRLERSGIILTLKSTPVVIKSFQNMYEAVFPKHILCIINVTDLCSLNCSYCFACSKDVRTGGNGKVIDLSTAKRILDFIYSLPVERFSIEFQGGEPLVGFSVIKEIVGLIEMNERKPDSLVIVSNLTLMNEDIADFIIDKKIGLCSSLDGPKELHDAQRKYFDGTGSYADVLKWIKYFESKGKKVNLLPTTTGLSLKFGARSIIDEYLSHGVNVVNLRPVNLLGRASSDDFEIDADEYFRFWAEGIEYMVELTESGKVVYDEFTRSHIRNILSPYRKFMCNRRPCGAGINMLSFDMEGNIFACDTLKNIDAFNQGNVKDCDYEDIIVNSIEHVSDVTEFQPMCDSCVYASYCSSCIARNHPDNDYAMGVFTPNDFDCRVRRKIFDWLFLKFSEPRYRKVFEQWAVSDRCLK